MRPRWLGIAACPLVAIAAASPAGAAEIRAAAPVAGPALAGERAVWADQRRDGGFDVRSAPIAGGPAQRLLSVKGGSTKYYEPRLAASPEVVVVEAIEHERDTRFGTTFAARFTFAGPPSGSLEQLGGRCGLNGQSVRWRSVDAFGNSFAYPSCESSMIEVRQLGSPLPAEQIPGSGRGLRLAGRYVAWIDGEEAGVSVSTTGRR